MIAQLMQGSSSVGGARAKTLIALNPETNVVRSGQIDAGENFKYRLLKFDDISNNKDKDNKPDNKEYTRIEYAYYLMAKAAGLSSKNAKGIQKYFARLYTKGDMAEPQGPPYRLYYNSFTHNFYLYISAKVTK